MCRERCCSRRGPPLGALFPRRSSPCSPSRFCRGRPCPRSRRVPVGCASVLVVVVFVLPNCFHIYLKGLLLRTITHQQEVGTLLHGVCRTCHVAFAGSCGASPSSQIDDSWWSCCCAGACAIDDASTLRPRKRTEVCVYHGSCQTRATVSSFFVWLFTVCKTESQLQKMQICLPVYLSAWLLFLTTFQWPIYKVVT